MGLKVVGSRYPEGLVLGEDSDTVVPEEFFRIFPET